MAQSMPVRAPLSDIENKTGYAKAKGATVTKKTNAAAYSTLEKKEITIRRELSILEEEREALTRQIAALESAQPIASESNSSHLMFSASESECASSSAPFGSVTSGMMGSTHGKTSCASPQGFAGAFSAPDELQMAEVALEGVKEKVGHLRGELQRVQEQRDEMRKKPLPKPATRVRVEQPQTRSRQPLPKESKPSDFEVLKQLGKGAFGTVLKVRRKCDDALYALKVLKKKDVVQNDQVGHIIAERNTLLLCSRLGHPFLVGMHASFQTKQSLYLVMDYMPCGDLYHYLRKEKRFSEARGGLYAAETILAVEHLHYLDIVHRDLKPENVLLDSDGHTRLTDFGLCKEHVRGPSGRSNSFCGTPEYMSPEVLLRKGHGKSVDWWCFGVLLFEMLTGDSPFYSANLKRTYYKICNAQYKLPETVPLSSWVVALLKGLLQTDPGDRLGCNASDAEELKSHPFFSKYCWKQVMRKEVQPEFVPEVKDPSNPEKAEKIRDDMQAQLEADYVEEEPQSQFYGFSYQSGTTVQRKDLLKQGVSNRT